jgi:Multiubiquitin
MDVQEHNNIDHLHIFVNRRKFDKGDGVRPEMTGAQIAELVAVPADNAIVREESPEKREIAVTERVHIKNGEHFLVTRKIVEGGNVVRTN